MKEVQLRCGYFGIRGFGDGDVCDLSLLCVRKVSNFPYTETSLSPFYIVLIIIVLWRYFQPGIEDFKNTK